MASVRKRGTNYYVVYYFQGKKHWKVIGPDEKRAKREKLKIEAAIIDGRYKGTQRKTFSDLATEWLELKEKEIRPNTFVAYRSAVRRLERYWGDRLLKDISVKDADELKASLLREEIAPATVIRCLAILKSMLQKAVAWGYIPVNPAEHVKNPPQLKAEVEYLEPEEIRRLIQAAGELDEQWGSRGHQRDYITYRKALIMFACLTGARQSEILGLRWGDLDLEEGRAFIRQVLQGGKFYPPKSQAGRRVIDLPPVLVEELKIHRLRQSVELSSNVYDLVFTNTRGKPLEKRNVTQRILEPSLERAGIRKVGFHALRHSYVSMLIAQGENVKTVQTLVGHSNARTTFDTYAHLFEGAGKAAARRLQETLFGELEIFDATHFATHSPF